MSRIPSRILIVLALRCGAIRPGNGQPGGGGQCPMRRCGDDAQRGDQHLLRPLSSVLQRARGAAGRPRRYHPVRGQFYRRLVGKDLSEVNAYWSRQIFSGRLQALPKVATPEEAIKWIAAQPCGIGFIEQAKADARFNIVYELAP
jgi:hypothetical protein